MKSKLDRRLSDLSKDMSREDSAIKKVLASIGERVGSLSQSDRALGMQVQTVKQRLMMMSKEDEAINRRLSKLSQKDEALQRDVMSLRPFLDVAKVDASGIQVKRNVNMAKGSQLCIDAQCMSSQDIANLKPAPGPPVGSVWRCAAVKVDKQFPSDPDIAPFPMTLRIEDNAYRDAIPSYPLSIRFTEIGTEGDITFHPIPVEADPTNSRKSSVSNYYPYIAYDVLEVAVPQRVFPMSFNGYGIGATCVFNVVGYFLTALGSEDVPIEGRTNAPAVFTRIS